MAEYLKEVLQDKLDLSGVNTQECKKLPSPEMLKGKVLVKVKMLFFRNMFCQTKYWTCNTEFLILTLQGKKLPANLDPEAEEGDVSDEDTGDEEDEEDNDDDDDDNAQANWILI